MFKAGRVDVNEGLQQLEAGPSWLYVQRGKIGILVSFDGSGKWFLREKWPVEGSHFPTQQGTCSNSGCSSAEK